MKLARFIMNARSAFISWARRSLMARRSGTLVPSGWSDPSGRYPVGVRDSALTGPGEQIANGVLRVWYPAVAETGSGRRNYFGNAHEQRTMTQGLTALLSARGAAALGARNTAALVNATPLGGTHPVVFFSHGFTGFVGQNSHLCEHLAAHGYLVISLAYPGAASAIAAPDGSAEFMSSSDRTRLNSDEFISTMIGLLRARSVETEDELLAQATQIKSLADENAHWSAHLSAVLDALVTAEARRSNVDHDTLAILETGDWSRIALTGMSFGGSTSANVAHLDHRVQAAVNLDGMQQGALLRHTNIRVPLLTMTSAGSILRSGRGVNDLHYEGKTPNGNVRRITVPNAGHFGFTDLVELGRGRIRPLLDLGQIDGAEMLRLVADHTLAFLNETLKHPKGTDEQ